MALLADGVSALLIDGKLTSGSGGTFPELGWLEPFLGWVSESRMWANSPAWLRRS